MDERSLKKRLNRVTIVVILISILILAGGSVASYYLRAMLEDTLDAQMESEAEQYKINISRKIDGDFQTLHTLSNFLRYSQMSTENFLHAFNDSRQYNQFIRLGYFPKDGTGTRVTQEAGIETGISLDDVDGNLRAVVENAWAGESGLSRIYELSDGSGSIYFYGVPVYTADGTVGALVAGVSTDSLAGILEDRSILTGRGYIHLISDTGRILVRAEDRVVEEELASIYEHGYIEPEEQQHIRKALEKGDACRSEFTYMDETYRVFLEPMEINGWYLFCVQTARSVNAGIYQLMVSTRIITVAVLLLIMAIILYGYRMIYQTNRRLIRSAWYDPLTGAYNMPRFEMEAARIIDRTPEYSLAGLNVRQFKFINEIFGNRQADLLLRHIKDVVMSHIREGEVFCRSTDDMFFILLKDTDRDMIRARLVQMMEEISRHAVSNNRNYQIMLYCGVVIGTDVNDVRPSVQKSLTHVRFALATARQSLKNSIWFYDTALHEDEKLENYVESHMHQALEGEEFQMYLQPKVDLETGQVCGAEALVRWIPSAGKMIYPGQFIPIFEKNGFCVNLDMYMVEKVCRQLRSWIDGGITPVPLSVNQSKLLFYEADYTDRLKDLLDRYKIPAELITLEILEGLAMENIGELNEKILKLKEIGFQISLDDFGSGYSSLNTLASLRIDELKFDRGFLAAIREESGGWRQAIIMKQIIKIAKKLSIRTVTEGVETKENEELIRRLGCECAQGYYYSRPVSAQEFTETYMK